MKYIAYKSCNVYFRKKSHRKLLFGLNWFSSRGIPHSLKVSSLPKTLTDKYWQIHTYFWCTKIKHQNTTIYLVKRPEHCKYKKRYQKRSHITSLTLHKNMKVLQIHKYVIALRDRGTVWNTVCFFKVPLGSNMKRIVDV